MYIVEYKNKYYLSTIYGIEKKFGERNDYNVLQNLGEHDIYTFHHNDVKVIIRLYDWNRGKKVIDFLENLNIKTSCV